MKKLISIDLFADFGMFKKPDTNEPVYLTFNMLHKPALLGILGAIIGEPGFKEKGKLPDYYIKLKDIQIGIQPLRHEKGNYSKTIITYNNTTGMASKEQGGNLMITEQTLIAPAYRCFFLIDYENPIHKKVDEYLSGYQAEYLPYLGKNEFSVWWNEYTTYSNYKPFEFKNKFKIISIFHKSEAVKFHLAAIIGRNMVQTLTDSFVYFERLPVKYQEIAKNIYQYKYNDFVFTNTTLETSLNLESILVIENSKLIQVF